MKKHVLYLFFTFFLFSVFAQKLPFQGKLTLDDEPYSGSVTLQFSIPDINWSETHEGVGVLDGFYSVVLGEITPLPDSLFASVGERQLNISVNGTALSAVTIYKPLTGGASGEKNIEVRNEGGELRGELLTFEPNDSGSLVLYGANDSTKVILGSAAGGYGGYLGLYDSLRNIGAQLRVTPKGVGNLYTYDVNHRVSGWFGNQGNTGGFMQLAGYNAATGAFTGATFTGMASWNNGLPYFIMEGSSVDPYTTLLEFGAYKDEVSEKPYFNLNSSSRALSQMGSALSMGIGHQDQAFIELKGGNDRNWDMRAQLRVDSVGNLGTAGKIELMGPLGNANNDVMGLFQVHGVNDPDGSDPEGASAEMFLWGTSTPNFQFGGKPWENNNHPYFQMFGSKGDGNGWHAANIQLDVHGAGTYDAGTINLNNTGEGVSYNTIQMMSSGHLQGGQLVMRNSTGQDMINLEGGTGDVYVSGNLSTQHVFESSDQRLKENIKTQENALEKVKQLRGVTFEWKKDKSNAQDIGFIAQEIEKVYPEVVHTKPDGYKAINYSALVSSLVEAIKELDAKVASLEVENKALKASQEINQSESIAKLQAEIDEIKKLLGASLSPATSTGASK